ncbi:hypothetical protein BH11PSE9_BH11PSE9_24790 [soil metagenome]
MKLHSIFAAVALVAAASSSFAATGPISFDGDGNTTFSNTPKAGSFTDTYTFTVPDALDLTTGSVTSKMNGAKDVDFSSLTITGGGNSYSFVQTGFDGVSESEQWTLNGINLSVGTNYTLTIAGVSTGKALYTGELSVAAVPEPETYALMLAGLAGVGFVTRRRQAKQA